MEIPAMTKKIKLNAAARLQSVEAASNVSSLAGKVKNLEEKLEKARIAYSKAARGHPSDEYTHNKRRAIDDVREELRKAKADLAKAKRQAK